MRKKSKSGNAVDRNHKYNVSMIGLGFEFECLPIHQEYPNGTVQPGQHSR